MLLNFDRNYRVQHGRNRSNMDKLIEEFLCPPWVGDRLITEDNIFSRISYMFQTQANRSGRRIGALHLKFTDGISEMVSHKDFTLCTEKRIFDWRSSEKEPGVYFDINVDGELIFMNLINICYK